ncbi:hypothetical protein TNCT_529161 [Trichonephila clavata]|uniref:Uncharacterized protein n=1 Tax=Trichonephila clavata TaxID=2740835 RepID=A0A8X6HZV4_TRICU|nr:hypothetical protein TNCT_529161 [Trichonephila clavata]
MGGPTGKNTTAGIAPRVVRVLKPLQHFKIRISCGWGLFPINELITVNFSPDYVCHACFRNFIPRRCKGLIFPEVQCVKCFGFNDAVFFFQVIFCKWTLFKRINSYIS